RTAVLVFKSIANLSFLGASIEVPSNAIAVWVHLGTTIRRDPRLRRTFIHRDHDSICIGIQYRTTTRCGAELLGTVVVNVQDSIIVRVQRATIKGQRPHIGTRVFLIVKPIVVAIARSGWLRSLKGKGHSELKLWMMSLLAPLGAVSLLSHHIAEIQAA